MVAELDNPNARVVRSIQNSGLVSGIVASVVGTLDVPETQVPHVRAYKEMRREWRRAYWQAPTKEKRVEAGDCLYKPRAAIYLHEAIVMPLVLGFRKCYSVMKAS